MRPRSAWLAIAATRPTRTAADCATRSASATGMTTVAVAGALARTTASSTRTASGARCMIFLVVRSCSEKRRRRTRGGRPPTRDRRGVGDGSALHDDRRPGPATERIDRARGDGVPAGREPFGRRIVRRLDVDPRVGQVAVDVEIEPRRRARAVDAEADHGLLLFERHRRPRGSGRAPRHRTGTIAVERTDGTHQFATHTLMLRLPVLPAESFTLTVRVVAPFAPDAVFHGSVAGRSPFVSVHTVRPLAVIVNVLLPAAALSTQIVTHWVPLTVAPPPAGCV